MAYEDEHLAITHRTGKTHALSRTRENHTRCGMVWNGSMETQPGKATDATCGLCIHAMSGRFGHKR